MNDQNEYKKGNAVLYLARHEWLGMGGRLFGEGEFGMADYTFKWSMSGPDEAPLTIDELECRQPSQRIRPAAWVLSKDFSAALLLKAHPDELKRTLASLFFDFAHTSTFKRGLASIAEMTVKAIAHSLGYELEFSYPEHLPSPDKIALAKFDDREGFVDEARTCFSLRLLNS